MDIFSLSIKAEHYLIIAQKKIEVSKISISSFMETEIAHLNRFFLYAMGKSDLSGQAQSP